MIACHNFDLDAAKAVGFKTAFVRRPKEWGSETPPDPTPNTHHDIIVDDFPQPRYRIGHRLKLVPTFTLHPSFIKVKNWTGSFMCH